VRDRTNRARLKLFLREAGRRTRRPIRLYLVGGSVLTDLGLRAATIDIDYVVDADDPAALAEFKVVMRQLKRELDLNIEPASPADFIPVPKDAFVRSRFVGRYGALSVYYYHLPSLVIAKVARGFEQDLADAERLIRAGEVAWADVETTWQEIRASPTGWLRYEPDEIEERMDLLRRRLVR
jgi:hypothetical protein